MARLKDITFESASLTGTNGADSAQGTIALDSASAMKGTYSARSDAAGDFVREDVTASDTLFVSFLIKFTTLPASTQTRVILIRDNLLNTVAGLRVTSAGKVQLRDSASTQIGSDSSLTISTNTIYRLGVRRTKSTSNNGVLEAYVVADGAAWGSPFASTSADTSSNQGSRVEVGQTTGGTTADLYVDNIRIDDASMPTDDVASTTFDQGVNVTASSSLSLIRSVGKIITVSNTPSFSKTALVNKALSFSAPDTTTVTKEAGKIVTTTEGNSVSLSAAITFLQAISASAASTLTILKQVGKNVSTSVDNSVSIARAVNYLKSIDISAGNAVTIIKSVGKNITATVSNAIDIATQFIPGGGTTFDQAIDITVNSAVTLSRSVGKIVTSTAASTTTILRSIGKIISPLGTFSVTIAREISKTIQINGTTAVQVVKQFAQTISATVSNTVSLVPQLLAGVIATAYRNISNLSLLRNVRTLSLQRTQPDGVSSQATQSNEITLQNDQDDTIDI